MVPVWAPTAIAWKQIRTSLRLWRLSRLARKASDRRLAFLCGYAWRACLEPQTLLNTLFSQIAKAVVRAWGAHVFVMFYKGAPYEKVAWHGAKAANPNCVTVGYQHSVVMRDSLTLMVPNSGSWELSALDVVLCVGR
jgi:hypothetical protein